MYQRMVEAAAAEVPITDTDTGNKKPQRYTYTRVNIAPFMASPHSLEPVEINSIHSVHYTSLRTTAASTSAFSDNPVAARVRPSTAKQRPQAMVLSTGPIASKSQRPATAGARPRVPTYRANDPMCAIDSHSRIVVPEPVDKSQLSNRQQGTAQITVVGMNSTASESRTQLNTSSSSEISDISSDHNISFSSQQQEQTNTLVASRLSTKHRPDPVVIPTAMISHANIVAAEPVIDDVVPVPAEDQHISDTRIASQYQHDIDATDTLQQAGSNLIQPRTVSKAATTKPLSSFAPVPTPAKTVISNPSHITSQLAPATIHPSHAERAHSLSTHTSQSNTMPRTSQVAPTLPMDISDITSSVVESAAAFKRMTADDIRALEKGNIRHRESEWLSDSDDES